MDSMDLLASCGANLFAEVFSDNEIPDEFHQWAWWFSNIKESLLWWYFTHLLHQKSKTTFLLPVAVTIDRKIPGGQEQLVTVTFTEICS